MRQLLAILTIIFLTVCCKNHTTDKSVLSDSLQTIEDTSIEAFTYNVYKSDSITIDVRNDNYNFYVLLTNGDLKKEYDLNKLNIPAKGPDEVKWANRDFACIMTWWSGAQSRHIFVPTKRSNELVYIDKDIKETDSVNNNVVYVDTVLYDLDKVVFKVENLLTRKSKMLTLKIKDSNSVYAFFDEIYLTRNKLTIKTGTEEESINIEEINNGT